MQPSPPQWPDQPPQMSGGKPPQSGATRILGIVVIISAVLIVALIGTLIVALSRGSQGGPSIGELPSGPSATSSAAATQGNEQPTANITPTTSQQGSGGNNTPVPTTSGNQAAPTATPVPPKPSVYQIVNQTTLSGSQSGPAPASCPSGEIALSGSWGIVNDATARPLSSFRTSARGWDVYVTHTATLTVKTYVECLKNAPGATIVERKITGIVAPGGTVSLIAQCNAGEIVVGGGFGGASGLEVYNSTANSGSEWLGHVANHNGGAISSTVDILAECLKFQNAQSSLTLYKQISIPSGAVSQVVSNPCPSGQFVSGGGFVDSQNGDVYAMLATDNNTTWTVGLEANGGHAETLNGYAECLRI
jgi:hypothetical protein